MKIQRNLIWTFYIGILVVGILLIGLVIFLEDKPIEPYTNPLCNQLLLRFDQIAQIKSSDYHEKECIFDEMGGILLSVNDGGCGKYGCTYDANFKGLREEQVFAINTRDHSPPPVVLGKFYRLTVRLCLMNETENVGVATIVTDKTFVVVYSWNYSEMDCK